MRFSTFVRVAAVFSMMTVFASIAEAQEKKVGLVIAFPLDVGVLWQASERVALRADVGFDFSSFESSTESGLSLGSGARSTITTTSSSGFTTIGVSALLTIRNDDNLRLYVAPRGAIEITHRTVETEIAPPLSGELSRLGLGDASDSTYGHEFDVMFGGQYRLRDRLALFGETGVAYRQSTFPVLTTSFSSVGSISTNRSGPDTRTTNIGLRSTVGLVLFF